MAGELVYYEDLAIRTFNWMMNEGAVRDKESKTRHTVTVEDWAKEFSIYLNDEGELTVQSHKEWQHVKIEMINQGKAIAVSPRGHYLGSKGEQATNVIYNIIHGLARIGRAREQMEAIKDSGRDQYLAAREHMRGKINPERVIGLIEASRGVSPLPNYQFTTSDDLLLLVAETEEQEKDKL